MPTYSKTALSWFGLKDAMLYFPYVIPFCEEIHLEDDETRLKLDKAIKAEVLPPEMRNKTTVEHIDQIGSGFLSLTQRLVQEVARKSTTLEQVAVEYGAMLRGEAGKDLREALISFFVRYPNCRSLPLIVTSAAADAQEEGGDIALTISSLNLIDTRDIEYAQLLEFRKDSKAMEKLRRLRLFAYENYTGKSRDFIEDDILTRIADYERAVKDWGFTTATGAINTVLDSKLIAGGVAGSVLSAYMQEPLIAIATTMGMAGVAIGKVAIDLGKQKIVRNELMANNPVSYVSYAREKLNH